MTTMKSLRKTVFCHPNYQGAPFIPASSVVNDAFPGTFNLSMAEPNWLEEFGDYVKRHDFILAKIQPCIRHQDWGIVCDRKDSTHLGLFDMATVGGAISLSGTRKAKETNLFCMKSLIDFFVKIGLDVTKLRFTYCAGGSVKNITKGKYSFEYSIESDPFVKYWTRFGINKKQFIPDKTRDTLLALNIFGRPTPWGYRNEILYEKNGKLLDIATFEYFMFDPMFNGNTIVNLRQTSNTFAVSAIGMERVIMSINGYQSIMFCNHINPLVAFVKKELQLSQYDAKVLTESVRVTQRILTDNDGFKGLGKNRRQKFNFFSRPITLNSKITSTLLEDMLVLNAELQHWYPELKKSIKFTRDELLLCRERQLVHLHH